MMNLIPLLEGFNLNSIQTEKELNKVFAEIATRVLFGGHFSIDGKFFIYPNDIEFYCHSDKNDAPDWKKDFGMYHTINVAYFPKCSLCPHQSGVDFRFEDGQEQFRASFLIRGYEFEDPSAKNEKDRKGKVDHPTYLWEDLFGYANFNGKGLNIQWVDDKLKPGEPIPDVRYNLCKYDDYNKPSVPGPNDKALKGRKDRVQDRRPWRFKR